MPRRRTRGDHIGRLDGDGLADVPESAGAGGGPMRDAPGTPRKRHAWARNAVLRARRTGARAGLPLGCSRARLHRGNHMPDRWRSDAYTHLGSGRPPGRVPRRT